MPPKKPAADSADLPAPSSSDAPVEENISDAATLRKLATHPSTAIMVKEALTELDSRKGVTSPAIQNYIKQKYPSVDLVRFKHFVRRALKKGIETGTLVRPANSNVTAGGRYRLAPKGKEAKPKTENVDPNVQKAPKAAKDGAKKPKKAAATKKKDTANEEAKSQEESKPPKKSKKEKETATEVATTATKAAPAKKPKAKKAAEKDNEGASDSAKTTKAAKTTKEMKTTKETKAGKASQSKAAKAGSDAPAARATGKRGKKSAE